MPKITRPLVVEPGVGPRQPDYIAGPLAESVIMSVIYTHPKILVLWHLLGEGRFLDKGFQRVPLMHLRVTVTSES